MKGKEEKDRKPRPEKDDKPKREHGDNRITKILNYITNNKTKLDTLTRENILDACGLEELK